MHQVELVNPRTLSPARARGLLTLLHLVWPEFHPPASDETVAALLERLGRPDRRLYAVFEADTVLAQATTFRRTVRTAEGPLTVLALARVCVHPDRRRRGLGDAVCHAAFAPVDEGRLPVSLFQTPLPDFYRALGARTVSNPFFDSTNTDQPHKRPWRDPFVMIYPAGFPWPDGPVDLAGPAW
jgi:hypothetical protein